MTGSDVSYTARERRWLVMIAVIMGTAVNGAFVYGLIFQPGVLTAALSNPIAAAFMIEAFVMVGLPAYLFGKWEASRLSWGWFVALSLLGGVAFAVPVALVWGRPAK
jgi:hypothetical protein